MNPKQLALITLIIGLLFLSSCNRVKLLKEETNYADNDRFEWVLSYYSDSTKTIKVAQQEIFSGRFDSVKTITAGKNAPLFFATKSYDGKVSVFSRDGNLVLSEDLGIREIQPLKYKWAPADYEMYKIIGESGNVGVVSPEMNIVFPMDYDAAYLDVDDNFYEIHEGSQPDSIFYVRLNSDNEWAVGSIDGKFYVPLQECDEVNIFRHSYYHNPYSKEVEESSWSAVIGGDHGDRADILGFKVKRNNLLSFYNLEGECVVPHGAKKIRPVFKRKPSEAKFYLAEYEDNTQGLYDKHGKEIIAPHRFNKILCQGEDYRDSDRPYGIVVTLNVEEGTDAEGILDYDGNEITPLLRDCWITSKDDEFVIYPPQKPDEDIEDYFKYGYKKYTAGAFAKYRYNPNESYSQSNNNNSTHQHQHSNHSDYYQPEYGMRDVWKPCNDCNGTGDCRYCNGKGWDYVTNGSGQIISSQKCIVCNGTKRCQTCYGSRGHYEKEQYQIR